MIEISDINLSERLRRILHKIAIQRKGRIFAKVEKENLKDIISKLIKDEEFSHLSTITGVDVGSEIELIYHIAYRGSIISIKVRTSKEDPKIPTIVDLIPGAILYEREIHDLFGVKFIGNPDLSPLILPDSWPDNVYPLRKDWDLERLSRRIGG